MTRKITTIISLFAALSMVTISSTAQAAPRKLTTAERAETRYAFSQIRLLIHDSRLLSGLDKFTEGSHIVVDDAYLAKQGEGGADAAWDRRHLSSSRMILSRNVIPNLQRELNAARARIHRAGPRRGKMIAYTTGSTLDPRVIYRAKRIWFAAIVLHEWFHGKQGTVFASMYSGANEYLAWSLQQDFIQTYLARHTQGKASRLPAGMISLLKDQIETCEYQIHSYSQSLGRANLLKGATTYYKGVFSQVFGRKKN